MNFITKLIREIKPLEITLTRQMKDSAFYTLCINL